MFLRCEVNKFYYSDNAPFIDFFEPFILYEGFFFDFLLSFFPNDELTWRLYLFDDLELDRFLLPRIIFCCDNIFLFCLSLFLSFIKPRVSNAFWFLVYGVVNLPDCKFLCKVICYFFFIILSFKLIIIFVYKIAVHNFVLLRKISFI